MNEQGLFEIMEKIHDWHNAKMRGIQYNKKQLQDLRLEIIELAGLDTSKLIDLAGVVADDLLSEIYESERVDDMLYQRTKDKIQSLLYNMFCEYKDERDDDDETKGENDD